MRTRHAFRQQFILIIKKQYNRYVVERRHRNVFNKYDKKKKKKIIRFTRYLIPIWRLKYTIYVRVPTVVAHLLSIYAYNLFSSLGG